MGVERVFAVLNEDGLELMLLDDLIDLAVVYASMLNKDRYLNIEKYVVNDLTSALDVFDVINFSVKEVID